MHFSILKYYYIIYILTTIIGVTNMQKKFWFQQNPKKTIFLFIIISFFFIEFLSFVTLKIFSKNSSTISYQEFDIHTLNKYKPYSETTFDGWKGVYNKKIFWKFDKFGLVLTPDQKNINNLPEKKIVIFGGSTVFGIGSSNLSNTIASNIYKIINKKNLDYFYRVYNAGTRGFFSYQEYIKYLNDIKKEINPDIVIVLNGRNDVYLASKGFLQENFDTEYSLHIEKFIKKKQSNNLEYKIILKNLFKKTFSNTGLLLKKISSRFKNVKKKKQKNYPKVSNEDLIKSMNNYILIMETFKFTVETLNKEFYWFLQPVAHVKKKLTYEEKERLKKVSNVENYSQIINFSYDYLIKQNNNLIDISNIFLLLNDTLYIDDCHYNDLANRIIAKEIVGRLDLIN